MRFNADGSRLLVFGTGVLSLLDTVNRAGRMVPEHLSLVGYDDIPASHFAHVNLTTVRQDTHEQAAHAVAAVVDRLDGARRSEAPPVVLPPQLVVRGTTGPPPDH